MVSFPSYSVVVCAYTQDRWDDLVAAVQSIHDQSPAPETVVVVVDHHQGLLDRALRAFGNCIVVANREQQGLSGARNTGMVHATGDVVAFLDDDARCEPAWAQNLLRAYDDPSVIGAGGHVVPDWRAARPAWLPEEFLWVVGCSYRGQPHGRAEVRNAIGANMSFRREVLARAGGFSHHVGRVGADTAGCEETELSIRARRSVDGGVILLVPDAVVRHAVTSTRITRSYYRQRCLAEGRSKAVVSELTGAGDALSAERSYVTRTLPAAVLRGVRHGWRGGAGLQQSWAVVEGLCLTAGAYALERGRRVVRTRVPARRRAQPAGA